MAHPEMYSDLTLAADQPPCYDVTPVQYPHQTADSPKYPKVALTGFTMPEYPEPYYNTTQDEAHSQVAMDSPP